MAVDRDPAMEPLHAFSVQWQGGPFHLERDRHGFHNVRYHADDVTTTVDTLGENTTLYVLQLEGIWRRYSSDGVVYGLSRWLPGLAAGLRVNDTLQELSLAHNRLDDEDMRVLGMALCENQRLTKLDLSYNSLDAIAGVYLVEFVRKTKTLCVLNLDDNVMGVGASPLIKALAENSSLREFSMANNRMLPHTLVEFWYVIKENRTLRKLDLRGNMLTDVCANILATVFLDNHSLIFLGLDDAKPVLPYTSRPMHMENKLDEALRKMDAWMEAMATHAQKNMRRVFTLDSLQKGCAVVMAEDYEPSSSTIYDACPCYVRELVQTIYDVAL